MTARRFIPLLVLVGLLVGLQRADAQPSKKARKAARAAFERGRDLQKTGDYAGAIAAYQEAHDHVADPALTFNIARCHHLDGNADAAIATYKKFIDEAPDDDDPAVDEARDYVAELEALLRRERERDREREEAREAERAREREDSERFRAAAASREAAAKEESSASDRDLDASLEAEAPAPAPGGKRRVLWIGAAAALVGAGLLLDTVPDSSKNDSLDGMDFAPVGLYAAGLAALAVGVF